MNLAKPLGLLFAMTALVVGVPAVSAGERVHVVISPPQARLQPLLTERFARRSWTFSIQSLKQLEIPTRFGTDWEDLPITAYVNLQTPGWARLVFAQPTSERFSIRDLPLPHGLNEVALETIAIVVDSVIDSLLSGSAFELSRQDAEAVLKNAPMPPSSPAPDASTTVTPSPPTTSATVDDDLLLRTKTNEPEVADNTAPLEQENFAWRRFAAVGFAGSPQGARSMPWAFGPTLMLGQHQRRAWIQLDLNLLPPTNISDELLSGSLTGAGVRGGWGRHRKIGAWNFVVLPLRAGVDVMRVTTKAQYGVTAAAPTTFVSPFLGAAAGVKWQGGGLIVASFLSVDLDLLGTRFFVKTSEGSQTLADLWRVRPALNVLIGWEQS